MCNKLVTDEEPLPKVYNIYAYDKVGQFLSQPQLKADILKDINNCVVADWKDCVYSKFRENEKRDTSDQISGMKVSKGVFKCKDNTCKSDECYYYTMQTSSCDESMTTYVVCSKCGNRYTIR